MVPTAQSIPRDVLIIQEKAEKTVLFGLVNDIHAFYYIAIVI